MENTSRINSKERSIHSRVVTVHLSKHNNKLLWSISYSVTLTISEFRLEKFYHWQKQPRKRSLPFSIPSFVQWSTEGWEEVVIAIALFYRGSEPPHTWVFLLSVLPNACLFPKPSGWKGYHSKLRSEASIP